MDENIQQIFHNDVSYKKRAARGIHGRASRRGYIRGGVKTQYDFLTTKEKKLLNGDVKVSNIYDDIKNVPSIKEINKMNQTEAHQLLTYIKNKHSADVLAEHFGFKKPTLSYYYNKFNVSKNKNYVRNNGNSKNKTTAPSSLPTLEDLNNMTDKDKYTLLSDVREKYTFASLRKHFKVGQKTMYTLLDEAEKYIKRNPSNDQMNTVATEEETSGDINKVNSEEILAKCNSMKEEIQKILSNNSDMREEIQRITTLIKPHKGLEININDECDKKDLEERLLALSAILMGDKKYNVVIKIREMI